MLVDSFRKKIKNLIKCLIFLMKKIISIIFFRKQNEILIISDGARFGNHLYFYLHAEKMRKKNERYFISYIPNMNDWLHIFPSLSKFTLQKEEISILDNKITMNSYYQTYNEDYNQDELISFITSYLKKDILEINKNRREELVIHVRRGDFYNKENFPYYAFQQSLYFKEALRKIDLKNINDIYIATDDIEWCKSNLDFIASEFNLKIHYPNKSQEDDFLMLTRAKKIILSNSTFAYWAAYINETVYADTTIIAPNFNTMLMDNGAMRQNLSSWILINVER